MSTNRRRFRQRGGVRTSVKVAFILAGTSVAGLVALLLVVFNLTRDEVSMAGTEPMIFISADVVQDTNMVLRGSCNNMVIGVVIETRGTGNPIKVSSIDFSTKGTTAPVEKQIEHARLWYTGTDKNFVTYAQVGNTIDVPGSNFNMVLEKALQAGKNYFWLTFDVKQDATDKNAMVDAECTSLKISVTDFLPLISSPAGNRKITNNIAFYSTGNKSVNNADAWNSKRDGSGVAPKNMIDSRYSFFIQSGHSMYASKEVTLPIIMVETGGTLNSKAVLKLNSLFVMSEGIYQQDAEMTGQTGINRMVIYNGGNYIHNNNGRIAGLSSEFYPKSSQTFLDYGESTFPDDQYWGTVQINASQSLNMNIKNKFSHVKGDLDLRKTGQFYSEGNDTMNIGGNLIISGGTFSGIKGNGHTLVINVEKDFIMKNGMFRDADIMAKESHTVLNLNDDFLVMDGTFDFNNAADGKSEINIQNNFTSRIYWTQKKGSKVTLCNVNIKDNKEVVLKGERMGDVAKGRAITVESGSKLMCDNYTVTGAGKFVLSDNATLGIGHIKGINSKTPDGNILTGERIFSSSANYIYYSGTTPQETGDFETQPVQSTIKSLLIKKSAPGQEVIMTQNFFVTGNAVVSMGSLNKGKFKLELARLSNPNENTAATAQNK